MKNKKVLSTEKYIRSLYVSNSIREPVISTAISQLGLPEGTYGLDIGCGIGLYTLLLAETVGLNGHVLGIDTTEEFLKKACSLASDKSLEKSVSFKKADASKLPFQDNTFDWAGSMDFVGYGNQNPVSLLKEAHRVVKPGGIVFILMWSSQMLLPGYPLLEARLNATSSGIAPFKASMPPELHFMRSLSWFNQIGFAEPIFRTFVRDISPPLSSEMRMALTELFQMRWGEIDLEVTSEDWKDYQRLCHPDSPDFILNVPDYCAFITYSLFCGRVVQ
ncbi:class I SAM-dependent methyltransferase [Desulfitobacterium chlororespirans]|uniref:Demethylmenaquinone methyltransferase / 2-methoxy-6-polyprenyl-1,4-benzoquinol methylase n=1 Tax=Desulfitobacterium chlororespirans DSM 11544 TaxID=1121395 RepID=A0A1M7UZT2_9FIRM|nr:methyltransferase domain-containing protein [Desulfitobacterium chlororespirans]SHN88436.1 demethylmenaquinone methyltransferase / 2-methoxy-6-polyprenyl-1,4-benzoquinol methylase [Desulfitobacterium chlororespirans DSM 11544]